MKQLKEYEHQLLLEDLDGIDKKLEAIDLPDIDMIRQLQFMKANVLNDLEKIEWELAAKQKPRITKFIDF